MKKLSWRNFRAWLIGFRAESELGSRPRGGDQPPTRPNPLTLVNQGLQELAVALNHQVAAVRAMADHIEAVQGYAADAWQGQEGLQADYYLLLRSILHALDDLPAMSAEEASAGVVRERLERILLEQHVAPMLLREGEPFSAEFHQCEQIIDSPEHPDGTIVRVLEVGYVRTHGDGSVAIVRPARVTVSKATTTTELSVHGS